jgi:hypothetical protein
MNDTHGSCTGAARSTSGHWAAHGHARNTRGPRTTVQGHRPCMGEPRRPRAALGRCAQGRAVPGIARTALGHCALRRGHCTCASRRAALAGRHGMPGRRAWPRHAAGGRGGSSARGVEVRGGRRDLPLRRQQLQARRVRRGGREEGRGGAGWRLHEASSDAGKDGALGSAAAAKGVAAGQERRFLLGGMTRGARTQVAAAAGHARALGFGEGAPALGGPRGRAREWAEGWLGRG